MLSPRSLYGGAIVPSRLFLALCILLSLIMTSIAPAYAAGGENGNVGGRVVDSSSGMPIANAKVTLVSPSGTYRATTDAQGQFSILGATVDTYTLSVESNGYQAISQSGLTVIGDQNTSVGSIKLSKELRTIGKVSVRSISSAFQPNQTVDSVTVNQGRIVESTGKAASTNENSLLLSVPGATKTAGGNITIRGGLANETGYQFDGIPYTEPFFSTNASNNYFSGLNQVQVVEGAGDATQGNVGGGVVNLIPKRGTFPGSGLFDAELGLPGQYNQGQLEYGIASQNGRVSNYVSYLQSDNRDIYGYPSTDAASYDNFNRAARDVNSDFIDNFVLKFGKNANQSLQVLYQNRNLRQYGPYGGVSLTGPNPTRYFQTDPFQYQPLGLADAVGGPGLLASILPLLPGQTSVNQTPSLEQQQVVDNTNLLKFEYDNQIDRANFVDLKLYNTFEGQGAETIIGQTQQDPNYAVVGGRRSGLIGDFIHQFTPNYTFTFRTELENQHPIWDGYNPYNLAQLLTGAPGTDGSGALVAAPNTAGSGQAPALADFLQPNAAGVCPVANGCYLSKYFAAGSIPKLPISGVNYNSALFQIFGFAVRNQINIRDRVKLDLGARYDGAIYKFGPNPFNTNPKDLNNPSDVDSSLLTNSSINPRTIDPRASVAYEMGRNDSIRAGYGRSTTFLNAQTAGTPAGLYNADALKKVPATDTLANPACGSGTNSAGLFKCANYAQQLYWLYDQNFDAPDLGGATAQVASNYDLTYQHQFANGFGLRLTPFYKLSTGLPSFALLSETVDPVTGAILTEVFTANNQGINRTTGVEFGLTAPERPYGFGGFFSATYQNVLDSAPPLINGEENLPIISSGSLALGNVYRAGYVSPFSARLGTDYKFKSGLRIAPVLQYDRGYPFNVGLTTASRSAIGANFQNVPSVNVGPGRTTIPGYGGATGGALATSFVDPANPGSVFNPNVAATRGTPESSSTGGVLYKPNLSADLTVEFKRGRNTVGVQATNLFGNQYFGIIPVVNPYYQPVSTGVSGPQTSKPKQANPTFSNGIYQNRGYANVPTDAYAYTNGAYLLPLATSVNGASGPTNTPSLRVYYQLSL